MHQNTQTEADNQRINFLNGIRIDWQCETAEHEDGTISMAIQHDAYINGWCLCHWKSLESF